MCSVSIPVSVLRDLWDIVKMPPWNTFKPVTMDDVLKTVKQKDWTFRHMRPLKDNLEIMELDHVRRIAWLVMHPPPDPILVDATMGEVVIDGCHRFYAAIIRGDEMINAFISGYDSHIAEWFGNDVLEQVIKSDEFDIEMQM